MPRPRRPLPYPLVLIPCAPLLLSVRKARILPLQPEPAPARAQHPSRPRRRPLARPKLLLLAARAAVHLRPGSATRLHARARCVHKLPFLQLPRAPPVHPCTSEDSARHRPSTRAPPRAGDATAPASHTPSSPVEPAPCIERCSGLSGYPCVPACLRATPHLAPLLCKPPDPMPRAARTRVVRASSLLSDLSTSVPRLCPSPRAPPLRARAPAAPPPPARVPALSPFSPRRLRLRGVLQSLPASQRACTRARTAPVRMPSCSTPRLRPRPPAPPLRLHVDRSASPLPRLADVSPASPTSPPRAASCARPRARAPPGRQ